MDEWWPLPLGRRLSGNSFQQMQNQLHPQEVLVALISWKGKPVGVFVTIKEVWEVAHEEIEMLRLQDERYGFYAVSISELEEHDYCGPL